MKLANTWVGYVQRSIQQSKDSILTKITNPVTGIPEMTDHTDSNVWIKTINIWTGLMELLHYYLDNATRELFLPVARQFKSLAYHAQLLDYRIKGRNAATVDLTFTLNSVAVTNVSIPIGTEVQSLSGVRFFAQETGTILAGNLTTTVKFANLIPVASAVAGTSDGSRNQRFELTNDIADLDIIITIHSVQWNVKETLAYSFINDLDCVVGINENGLIQIEFGDGKNGVVPASGDNINYTCHKTNGTEGNLPTNSINNLISVLTLPVGKTITVNNINSSTGGSEIEDIERVRKNIPLSTKSLYKAVTKDDYKSVAELASGVAKAGVFYNCGRTIAIYISPDGSVNGIASDMLIAATQAFMQNRIMLTTRVDVKSAGIVAIKQVWYVVLRPGYSNAGKETEIKQALADFLTISNQLIYGKVEKGDLYQIVEGIEGVDFSRLEALTTVPYARPVNHNNQLTWTRAITVNSSVTVRWTILKTSTGYQLLKDGNYIGNYSWAALNTQTEITFTPTNNVSAPDGSVWEFYTYKYNDNLQLEEPSVPISDLTDLTVNVTGGI